MGLAVAALEQLVIQADPNKSFQRPITYIQQTVNTFTIGDVYRYATLLLGVRVCLWRVRIDT